MAWEICNMKRKLPKKCIIQAQWQNIFTIFLSGRDVIRGNKVSKLYKFMTFYHKFHCFINSYDYILHIPQRWFQITFRKLSNCFRELRQFVHHYLASNLFLSIFWELEPEKQKYSQDEIDGTIHYLKDIQDKNSVA